MNTIKSLMDLTRRVALITGGGGHIGRAIAETLAELGADLLLLDCNEKSVEDTSNYIKKHFPLIKTVSLVIDLEEPEFIKTVLQTIEQEFQQLDILINNAAFVGTSDLKGWVTEFKDQNVNTWRRALEVNLTAPFVLIQGCADFLKQSQKGSIINIGSTYGVVGPDLSLYKDTSMGNPAAYAASKGGLIQLTRWLATVLAPDIRVNSISPGGLWRNQPQIFCDRYVQKTPLKRMGQESDLKGAIAYFASDLSLYVTGQNLLVDGGWIAW